MAEISIQAIAAGTARIATSEPVRVTVGSGNTPPVEGKSSPRPEATPQPSRFSALVDELNSRSRSIGRSIRFQVDVESRNPPIIQVLDRDTGKLIRQIPADQAAVLAENRQSFDLGRVIDIV